MRNRYLPVSKANSGVTALPELLINTRVHAPCGCLPGQLLKGALAKVIPSLKDGKRLVKNCVGATKTKPCPVECGSG